jgi:monofunctional biosynthetic peptidoglycan transglycosylase
VELPEPQREEKPRRPRRLLRIVGVVAAGCVIGALVLWYLVIPYPWTLRTGALERTALMTQRLDEASAAGSELIVRREWVPLDQISSNLVRAVLVAEDYRFREHEGVDWVSLAEEVQWTGDSDFSWWSLPDVRALRTAVGYARRNRDDIRGRSTITQQLAKNIYFGTDRSFARKAMEFVVAGRLERRLGKDRILELYLNVVEWGPGVFGAEAAARTYFGRSAADLTLDQAATLAATLPHPLTSNPAYQPARMAWRRDLILARLSPGDGIPEPPAPIPAPELWVDLQTFDIDAAPPITSDPTGM